MLKLEFAHSQSLCAWHIQFIAKENRTAEELKDSWTTPAAKTFAGVLCKKKKIQLLRTIQAPS